ncbi:response regulator [Sporosarcina koreensis]|uniref:Transcriptional regulatory protein n=1 Tax=Sporosarcina koreensis TaxID=334735 RepID=A0ABW0U3K7_9BACL
MNEIKVLIIEDDFRVAQINKQFIEQMEGFEVCGTASTIQEGKDSLLASIPDLVLLDVYFPDGNGIEMIRHIRNHHKNTDIILITAAKELETVQEAIRGGVIDYIIKPVMLDRFQRTLQKYAEYWKKLKSIPDNVDQEKVDALLNSISKEQKADAEMPKGIDPLTLEKINDRLISYKDKGITAETLCKDVGMSRTTVRRYLEYLVSTGIITAELSYGQVGRPERVYLAN